MTIDVYHTGLQIQLPKGKAFKMTLSREGVGGGGGEAWSVDGINFFERKISVFYFILFILHYLMKEAVMRSMIM